MLENKKKLIRDGTGSFTRMLVPMTLGRCNPKKVD